MITTTICNIGNSKGVRLSAKLLKKHTIKDKDTVTITDTPIGILITKKTDNPFELFDRWCDDNGFSSDAPRNIEELIETVERERSAINTKKIETW